MKECIISKENFINFVKQYKELNPDCTDIDFANYMFNAGYFYGRKKKRIRKFDIGTNDWRYKHNPY